MIASVMRTSVRDAVVIARQASRKAGIKRLAAEAESLGAKLNGLDVIGPVGLERDWMRARALGQSFSERWLKKAVEAKGDAAVANKATAAALERIGVTESSQAFSNGRSMVADNVVRIEVMRVWDATLDKRTCPICSDADGTIVGVREAFPAGEPGSQHPGCRCNWQLMTLQETRRNR